jgi:hypothetical protein
MGLLAWSWSSQGRAAPLSQLRVSGWPVAWTASALRPASLTGSINCNIFQ